MLAVFCYFWSVHKEGVTGVAQEAVDLLSSGSTHTASLLYIFNGAAGAKQCERRVHFYTVLVFISQCPHTLPLPVYELSNWPEVVAHAEGVDVVDWGQTQVQLQRLQPVLPFDLQRYSDALTFTLLQPRQICQQAGAVFGAIAPQQAHSGPHKCCQGAVVVTRALEGTWRLTCDREIGNVCHLS